MTEQTTNTTPNPKVSNLPSSRPNQPFAAAPKPDSQPNLNLTHQPAASVPNEENATAGSHGKTTLYVIKSGDTLTRIAKTHGTTVKALRTANSLENDRIVVGAKLKIPEA